MFGSQKVLVGIVVGSLVAGCSSTTTNNTIANCGAGTELRDGVCVPLVDSGTPTDDTSIGTDAMGADVASSETDAVATGDATSGDAPTDGVGSDVVSDGSKDTIDAAPPGDPCPTHLDVDCSGACGGDASKCVSGYTCFGKFAFPPILITSYDKVPFVIRLPDHPGTDPGCQPRCGAGNTVWGFGVHVQIAGGARKDGFRARVSPPWQIYPYDPYFPFCTEASKPGGSCLYTDGGDFNWFIGTSDPNAASRNATIEWVPTGGDRCP